jgi:hypothetical protein
MSTPRRQSTESQIAVFYYGVYIEHTGGTALNSGDIVQDLRLTNVTYGVFLTTIEGSIVRNNQITCGPTLGIEVFSWGQISIFNITLAPQVGCRLRSRHYGAITADRRGTWLVPCAQPRSRTPAVFNIQR